MTKFLASLFFLFSFQAEAVSLHPCTPTVRAQPTYMSCSARGVYYEIKIETLMSRNIRQCSGKNHYEYNTAYVVKRDRKGRLLGKVTIQNQDFHYKLGLDGSRFQSKKPKMNLRDCVAPQHGAMSIGN